MLRKGFPRVHSVEWREKGKGIYRRVNKPNPTGQRHDTMNKAGPTGSSFVTPGLLFSRVVRCHKKGLKKITTGQHSWTLNVHRELTSIICMSISHGSK